MFQTSSSRDSNSVNWRKTQESAEKKIPGDSFVVAKNTSF